jgi:hypothetical protein
MTWKYVLNALNSSLPILMVLVEVLTVFPVSVHALLHPSLPESEPTGARERAIELCFKQPAAGCAGIQVLRSALVQQASCCELHCPEPMLSIIYES